MAMPSTDASALPTTARERRWSLAAAIASVTVFGLSVGQSGPLLPLLLEQRGSKLFKYLLVRCLASGRIARWATP